MVLDVNGKQTHVAGRGTTSLGVIGTVLGGAALLGMNNNCGGCNNGILGNLFGGNNNCYPTKAESALESKIAYLEGRAYTDSVGIELYRQLVAEDNKQTDANNSLFRETFTALAALDKETAVNKKEIDKNFELINQKIDYSNALIGCEISKVAQNVQDNYVAAKKVINLCDICPTPQVLEKVEQPTKVCVN